MISANNLNTRSVSDLEQLYRLTFENAAVGIAHVGRNGRFIRVNRKLAEITGYPKEELMQKSFQEITHPDDLSADLYQADALYQGKIDSYCMEKRYIRKNGSLVWVKLTGSAVFDDNNALKVFIAVIEDISEQKLAEAAFQEKQEQLTSTLNSITECYIALDRNYNLLKINDVAEKEIFHRPADGIIGKNIWELYPKGKEDIFHREYEKAFREQVSVHFEAHSNITAKWLEVHAYPRGTFLEVFFRNITDRKNLEEALRKSEHKFSRLFFSSPGFMFINDIESGNFIEVNDSYCRLTGYAREELIGNNSGNLGILPEETRNDIIRQIKIKGKVDLSEVQITNRNGELLSVLFSAEEISINGTTYIISSGIDITIRKKAEEALRQSEQRFKIAASVAKIGTYSRNLQTGEDSWSPEFLKIYGYQPGEPFPLKDGIPAAVHPDDRQQVLYEAQERFNKSTSAEFNSEHRIILPGGEVRWVNIQGRREFDDKNLPLGTYGIAMDITERKNAEKALRESEEKFRLMANNISQLAWMADEKGQLFWYNQRWFDYTGTTPEEMQRAGWTKVLHPEYVDRVVPSLHHSWQSGEKWEDIFPLRGKDHQYRWFLARALPIKDSNGTIIRWFGTNTDITKQREFEELLKNNSELFENLLYITAHDLKGPVANMHMALNIFDKVPDNKKIEIFRQFRPLVDRLDKTIKGVTDILKVQKADDSVAQTLYFENVLNNLLIEFKDKIKAGALQYDFSSLESIRYIGPFLYSIIKNLISNAIKYRRDNEALSIQVTTQVKDDYHLLVIQDNGTGIDLDKYGKQLFSPFQRFNPAKAKGTGVGLYIIKSIIEKNGGYIEVESTPGRGTTFNCYLKSY